MPDISLETIDDGLSRKEMAENEVEVVADELEDGDDRYDELDVLVHPGYTGQREAWEAYDFLDEGMYEEYREDLDPYVEGVDGEAVVLYPLPEYEEVREAVDAMDGTYIGTLPNSGVVHPDERERFGSVLADVEDGGTVHVSGELNGICVDHISGLVQQAADDADRDIAVNEHMTFPKGKIGELYGKTYLTDAEDEYGSGPSLGEAVRGMIPFTG